jgi:hypothetical protein
VTSPQTHLKSKGTIRRLTAHDTPSSNGVAERKNRTIIERAHAIFFQAADPPKTLWGEAMKHVVWLMNRTGSRTLNDRTPFETARGHAPLLTDIREWYCEIWVHVPNAGKLDRQASKARFIGYDGETKGYRVWWPGKNCISVERNIVFAEKDIPISTEQDAEVEAHRQITVPTATEPEKSGECPSEGQVTTKVSPNPPERSRRRNLENERHRRERQHRICTWHDQPIRAR